MKNAIALERMVSAQLADMGPQNFLEFYNFGNTDLLQNSLVAKFVKKLGHDIEVESFCDAVDQFLDGYSDDDIVLIKKVVADWEA